MLWREFYSYELPKWLCSRFKSSTKNLRSARVNLIRGDLDTTFKYNLPSCHLKRDKYSTPSTTWHQNNINKDQILLIIIIRKWESSSLIILFLSSVVHYMPCWSSEDHLKNEQNSFKVLRGSAKILEEFSSTPFKLFLKISQPTRQLKINGVSLQIPNRACWVRALAGASAVFWGSPLNCVYPPRCEFFWDILTRLHQKIRGGWSDHSNHFRLIGLQMLSYLSQPYMQIRSRDCLQPKKISKTLWAKMTV